MTPTTRPLLAVAPLALVLACGQPPGESPRPADRAEADPTPERIRYMLRDVEPNSKSRQTLVGMGRRAFPVYEAILSDPKSDPYTVERTFAILREVDADRSQFRDYAVQRLADPNWDLRTAALFLLEKIGGPRETPPIVAILSDKKPGVARGAATVLLAIGDERTVVAMDVWLNSDMRRDDPRGDEWVRKHVAECRDKLKQRLEKEKKARQ